MIQMAGMLARWHRWRLFNCQCRPESIKR